MCVSAAERLVKNENFALKFTSSAFLRPLWPDTRWWPPATWFHDQLWLVHLNLNACGQHYPPPEENVHFVANPPLGLPRAIFWHLFLYRNLLKLNMQGSDHFHKEIQNLCLHGLGSRKYAKLGHFTLLFGRERQQNAQRSITHVHAHSYCSAH